MATWEQQVDASEQEMATIGAAAIPAENQEEAIKIIAHVVSAMLSKFVQKLGGPGKVPQAIQQQGQQMTGNEQVIQAQAKRINDLEATMASESIERNHQAMTIKSDVDKKCKA